MKGKRRVVAVVFILAFLTSELLTSEACTAADETSAARVADATIRALVLDKLTGQPIEGASVSVWSQELPPLELPDERLNDEYAQRIARRDLPAVRADGRGLATCAPLSPGRHIIEAWADDYVKQWKEIVIGGGAFEAEIEFRLTPGAKIEGAVRDAKGNPLSAQVLFIGGSVEAPEFGRTKAMRPDSTTSISAVAYFPPFTSWTREAAAVAKADARGEYRLEFVPRNEQAWLLATAAEPGYRDLGRGVRATWSTLAGIDFALEHRLGRSVRGIAVDENGQPVAGAVAEQVGVTNRPVRRRAVAGADGRFRVDDLDGRSALLVVRAPGFAPRYHMVQLAEQDGQEETKFVLSPGHRIRGRVVDEQLAGVPQVEVALWPNDAPGASFLCLTDENGEFASDSLPAACRLGFSKPGYFAIAPRQLEVDVQGVTLFFIERRRARRIKVASAENGQPLREFSLGNSLRDFDAGKPIGRECHIFTGDGSVELSDLWKEPPSQLVVEAEGYVRRFSGDLSLAARDEEDAIEIALEVDDAAKHVRYAGRVSDDVGSPVADVEVRLLCAVDGSRPENDIRLLYLDSIIDGWAKRNARIVRCESARTDAQGRFAFAGVPRTDRVFMVWWKEGIAPGRRVNLQLLSDADAGQLEFRADPPTHVEIHIDRQAFPNAEAVSVFRSQVDEIVAPSPV